MTNIQRDQYPFRASVSESKPQFALPTIEQKSAQFVSSTFTAGTDFTVPAGAAGASVTIQLKFAPILGNNGRTAYFGNTTLVPGGALATTLTTEVPFVADTDGKGGSVTSLTNGQYMVDYETGIIYGKRADTGTTGTIAYSYWLAGSVAGTGSSSTQTQGTAVSGAAAVGNPVQVGGVFNSSAPTLSNGNISAFQLDSSGNLLDSLATRIAGEDLTNDILKTEGQFTATRINTATTTVLKASAGYLKSITIGTTAAGAITIYNNTAASGTIIAVLKASIAEQTFTFDAVMSTGITIVTAAASDISVSWR